MIGAGGGMMGFGLGEDMPLLSVAGLVLFVVGFLSLRAVDRE